MIKMALDEYDTLEITIGARLPVGLIEVSHREAAGFRAPKTFVSFRDLWVSDDYPSVIER
jgi:hypothetical protein